MVTVENGTYTQYTYDRDSIIADYDKNVQRKTRYVRGNDLISQKDKEGTTSYYLHNAHGDVTKLVDSSGNVRNSYSYDAFGNTTIYTEQVENRFRYTGDQYDTVTGQIYLRARYYDPSIGRFTQEDPYRGDGLNLYTYVSNNPVNYIDPTGLAKCAAAKNFDKALDGLQTVLDIAGFVPGLGDIMDAVNLGISVFRGNVLDAVFSSIAMIPGLGSAIATPLKTIFNAVGNATGITKAIGNLGILFGGTNKIVSKLDGISASLKTFANKIPNLIASLKNNWLVKSLIGKKQLNNIVSGVRSGINSLISRANEVISTVKKTVKKDIAPKRASKTVKYGPMNKGPLDDAIANTFRSGTYTKIVTEEPTTLYRVYGGKAGQLGSYWTTTKPQGPVQSMIDSALSPSWGNTATEVVSIKVPKGKTIYQGYAAQQGGLVGGGIQVYIKKVDSSWIVK